MTNNSVSIIIPVFNQADLTRLCLEYVLRVKNSTSFEIIVVDNGSTDHTREVLDTLPESSQKIVNRENLGFSKACNQGAEAAKWNFLVFLNNDTVPQDGWLDELVNTIESNPNAGVVGSKLFFPDETLQHAGVVFHLFSGMPYHIYMNCDGKLPCANLEREVSAVTGACLLISKELFRNLKGFDEKYINGMEDMDLCLKVKNAGRKIFYNPGSSLMHFASRTASRQSHMDKNRRIFIETWKNQIPGDDYSRLKQDNMVLGVNPDNFEFFFISSSEYQKEIAGPLKTAAELTRTGKLNESLKIYSDMVRRFPFSIEGLEKVKELSEMTGMQEPARNISFQIERLKSL